MDTKLLVGLTLKQCKKLVERNNMKFRITKEDEKIFVVTYNFDVNRVNVEVEKGIIKKAGIG